MHSYLLRSLISSLVLIPSLAAAAPLFRITDVGEANSPTAINEYSQVLVQGTYSGAQNHVWDNGVTKNVSSTPDAVFDFNDKGRVVGYIFDQQGQFTTPVYWPKAGKDPHTLASSFPGGSSYDRATGINTRGQIVGWLYYNDFASGPAYWDTNGALYDLRPFVEVHGFLFPNYPKINDKGMIALTSGAHGYKIDAASFTTVQLSGFDTKHAFQCNDCSQALGINDQNIVVGASRAFFTRKDDSNGVRNQATMWSAKNKAKNLGVLKLAGYYPDVNSYAVAINSSNWVIGYVDNFYAPQRAFLWTPDTGIADLNDLIDPADPKYGLVTLLSAYAINNKGEITGILIDSTMSGAQRIYKLTPSS